MEDAGDIIRQTVDVVEHLRQGASSDVEFDGTGAGQCRDGGGIVQE